MVSSLLAATVRIRLRAWFSRKFSNLSYRCRIWVCGSTSRYVHDVARPYWDAWFGWNAELGEKQKDRKMRKNFDKCFEMLLAHEGGFVNHPDDPGGATNLGVTKRTLQNYLGRHVSMDEMRNLTPEDVKPIYRLNYADAVCFDDLPAGLDWAMLDWAVNSGSGRAAMALQKIVGAKQDGAIGPKTLQAVANYEAAETIGKLHDSRQKFYEGLSHFKTFGRGWTRRNKETLKAAIEML